MNARGTIYLVITIISLIAICAVFYMISKRCPKGTLLVVGIGLWIGGQTISKTTSIRELVMVGGICTLSGIIGGLLGIFDLFRKDKKTSEPPPPLLPE